MTITEKTHNSASHTRLTLYKEGLFYKCYNEDAMVFVHRVRAYKVTAKFIKSVVAEVYSIGFPVSDIKKCSLTLAFISEKIEANNSEIIDGNIFFCS